MNYREQAQLARNDDFRERVQQAIIAAACIISDEGASTKQSVDQRRLDLCRQVLHEPNSWAQKFAFGVATYVEAGATDAEIALAVKNIWNSYAGVNPKLVAKDPDNTLAAGIVSQAEIDAAQAEAPAEVKALPWYTKWFGIGG